MKTSHCIRPCKGLLREVKAVVVPPGASSVRIEPRTSDPVLLVPSNTR